MRDRITLLTPGPVALHPHVAVASHRQNVLHHRMHDFSSYLADLAARLDRCFAMKSQYGMGFLNASGTGMTEALVRHFHALSPQCLVILTNGHFGDRLCAIADSLGIRYSPVRYEPTRPVPLPEIEAHLLAGCRAVIGVYHETSLGQVNADFGDVLLLCERRSAFFGVDMVSALGGERVDFSAFTPHVAVSVSGKALGALPGIGIALVRKDILRALEQAKVNEHYLSFSKYIHLSTGIPLVPFTPALSLFAPLKQALCEIEREGLEPKMARHEEGVALLEDLAGRFGFAAVPVRTPSSTTRTFSYSKEQDQDFERFSSELRSQGFLLLQNPLTQRAKREFQLSTMGFVPVENLYHLGKRMRRLAERWDVKAVRPNPMSEDVFFDFDGTMVSCDTVVSFLFFLIRVSYWRLIFTWPVFLLGAALQASTRTSTVGLSLLLWATTLFMTERKFRHHERSFGEIFVRERLSKEMIPVTVEHARRHLAAGDCLHVVSGSSPGWLKPILAALFGESRQLKIVGTKMTRRLGGIVVAQRCFRNRKLKCYTQETLRHPSFKAGYSDSWHDLPILQRCHLVFLVNRKERTMVSGESLTRTPFWRRRLRQAPQAVSTPRQCSGN